MAAESTSADVRFRIAAARRMLYNGGCDSGIAGHVSVRADEDRAYWITPFEYFDETLPERVIKVSFDLELLEGDWEPSPVIGFHSAIYSARPDVNSIIHTHAHYTTVLSTTRQPVGMYSANAVIFADIQAFYEDDGTAPSVEPDRMVIALGTKRVLFMKNHGALIAAESLESATIESIALEDCARTHVEAVSVGGTEMAYPEVLQSGAAYDKYYRRQMWEANLRRLRRSDPDLFASFAFV
jgi:L-fuculose-phosphate aldolase